MENQKGKKIVSGLLLCSMLCYTMPVFALSKEETVYSKLKNDGTSYETIVSNHIKNDELLSIIEDMSDLLNIKNTGGDETFSVDDNTVIWNAGESDIYYQGETSKQLPVITNIKYELDGEEISAKDLAGKKGNVKIIISYENKDAHTVKINGKDETLYTPFVTVTGVAIDNKLNKNIEITNGKIIEKDGETILIGVTFPGLKSSLGINSDKLDIPETIEITMDSEDFEIGNMLTYITPKVLEDDDKSITEQVKDLYNAVDEMQDASNQIEQGALTLKDGTAEYNEKSNEFTSYMGQLANGTQEAENGAKTVAGGVNELSNKTKALTPGVSKLVNGSVNLEQKINYIASSAAKLSEGAASSNAGIKKISEGVDGLYNALSAIDTNTKIAELKALINKDEEMKVQLQALNTQIEEQIASNKENEDLVKLLTSQKIANTTTIAVLDKNIDANKESESSLKSIASMKSVVASIKAGIDGTDEKIGLKDGLESLDTNLTALASGLEKLDDGAKTLVDGTGELSANAEKLIEGINTLKAGTTQLSTGLTTVNNSTNSLYSASTQLTDSSKTIADGMSTLSDGIQEFNTEAIGKICNYVNGDLKNIVDRADCLKELSKEYINFSMIDEKMNGNVKFILMTDPIKKDSEN